MALDAYALATVAQVRAFTGWTVAEVADVTVEDFINAATDMIERHCRRLFMSRAYTEYPIPDSKGNILLDQRPIASIQRLTTSTVNALSVVFADANGSDATVSLDEPVETLTLRQVVSGTVTSADIDLTLAANDTIAELATAITAEAGWTGTVSNTTYNAYPSGDLWPVSGLHCLTNAVTLEIVAEPATDFGIDHDQGLLTGVVAYGISGLKYRVDYTAGYTTRPYALQQICIELAKRLYDFAQIGGGLLGERLGPYEWRASVELQQDGPLGEDLKSRLVPFQETLL